MSAASERRPFEAGQGRSKVALASTSVYPESLSSSFELAAAIGYDGIELMVGIDPVSTDIDYVEKLRDYHQVAVVSIHAPTLIITQSTWGTDHWAKLRRTIDAAERLGADVIVVHPPFRWQGDYATGFEAGLADVQAETEIKLCVENMYPWRTPAGALPMYLPHWDPTNYDFPYLTLDLSHAGTAKLNSLDFVEKWGSRLQHVHLTDSNGSALDEHLFPGEGSQRAWDVVRRLAETGYTGHIVHEVSSRRFKSRSAREERLAQALATTREVLAGKTKGV